MSTPSVATAVAYGAILDVKDKHSLYVSNLSVTVTENTLREIFHSCGKLDQVIFRTYPGSLKWYAQLNFRTSEGVVEASKLEGTAICGCAIKCSAVDPTCFAAHQVIEELKAKEDATEKAKEELEAARQEWYKKLQEHKEARKKRTVHVDGLPPQTTLQELQQLAEQFGTVEQLRLDRDAKGGAFGLVQFKDQSVARGCCLRQTFLVDEHVVVISASKSEVNSMDIEEATVEFRHPVIERALASTGGRESNAGAPQGKFWEELAEKQRQLYNEKLDQVRQHAEAILGPGVVPAPAPAASPPPEEDFFAWAKQAAAFFEPTPEAIAAEAAEAAAASEAPEEEPQKGPVDIEEHPDIVPGTELAVLQDSSSEEISDEDHENEVELAGGFFADGPRAQRQRRAALRRRAAKERGLARAAKAKAKAIPSPAQWAAARAVALERLQNSPAQWAAARARALVCCPDLMVPRGSQSVLGVPSLKEQRAQFLDVVDPIGMPILKVEVLRAQDPSPRVSLIQSASSPGSAILPPGATRRPLLALRNLRPEGLDRRLGNEPNAMAVAFQRGEALEICTPELSIFGVLEKEESPMGLRFVLRVGSEAVTSIIFQGTSVHSGLAVTDAANKILARTQAGRLKFEAGGRFYSLQVHAGVDVGVLLCCLLFIDGLGAGLF
ncbi:unnamed protein product [Effrenium voratum]|nr:unnamed protein product [Effrenium voratum]